MLEVCRAAAEDGLPIFLFGGSASWLEVLSKKLFERVPNLQIAGARPSKFRKLLPDEWHELVEEVKSSGARVMFVGLGCPRQEVFAYEAREALSIPTIAVGAAFNFHSGLLPQAPPVLQRWGLEWFYRLLQEPRRLWRRYVLLNPVFLALLTLQALNLHHVEAEELEPPEGQMLYG
jgi:exopolysaccharide biosynthesis WecB/TagA/CpsF family protein